MIRLEPSNTWCHRQPTHVVRPTSLAPLEDHRNPLPTDTSRTQRPLLVEPVKVVRQVCQDARTGVSQKHRCHTFIAMCLN
jgi:hypothetical protein